MNSEETTPSLACESMRRFENLSVQMGSEIRLFEPIGWISYRNGILKRLLKPVLETAFETCFLKQVLKTVA